MKPYFFVNILNRYPSLIILQNQRCVQVSKLSRAVKIKFSIQKYLLFALDLARKSI